MTVLVSFALIFQPTFAAVEPHVGHPVAYRAAVAPASEQPPPTFLWTDTALKLAVFVPEPVAVEVVEVPAEIPAPADVPPPPSAIDVALNRLGELGATPFELRTFGCIAWFESRNNPWAVSPTNDRGIFQINGVHRAKYVGRDIFDLTVNAEVAWQVYQSAGFRAWTVHGRCGV